MPFLSISISRDSPIEPSLIGTNCLLFCLTEVRISVGSRGLPGQDDGVHHTEAGGAVQPPAPAPLPARH
jgi:hypothetical protein